MKTTLILFAACTASSFVAFAYVPRPAEFPENITISSTPDGKWTISEPVDEMKGVKGYAISASGTLEGDVERPTLVVMVARQVGEFEDLFRRPSNQSKKITYEARILLYSEEVLETTKDMLVRFDDDAAARWTLVRNESCHALHIAREKANDFANEMLSAKTMLVRYTAFPGKPRTARFDLSGFAERFAEVKARMRKR